MFFVSAVTQLLKIYLDAVAAAIKAGNATEHTHRPALKALLDAVGAQGGAADIRATNEPRRIDCGAPDFIVTRGLLPLGYVEAKDVGAKLDKAAASDQLARYRESLPNLILTDYVEFRWYVEGDCKLSASLPRPDKNGKFKWNEAAASEVAQLLAQFIQADLPVKATPHELATRMAGLGRLIRGLITETFKAEGGHGELHAQLKAFRDVLMGDTLTEPQFADMYAQTLCYGLFAARCTLPAGSGFTRQSAAHQLPKTNPFLRKLFHQIAGPDLDERIAWAVDQLAELLARADMAAILETFGLKTRQEDPVVHFYETFLAAYDRAMREARGVYYTPEPVVGYIVRSVDALLKTHFAMPEGLAHAGKTTIKVPPPPGQAKKGQPGYVERETHRLQILDPATGTGTFLHTVIQQIRQHFVGNDGAWPGYVAEHLLPRLFGFELLMAPYAVAHMKLGLTLEASGYDFASDQRLGVYLTNSLEEAHELTHGPLFTQWLADESLAAAQIKRDAPVMVVLGNPPYSGHSANTGDWIAALLRGADTTQGERPTGNYFAVDGQPLGERNPKWLNDDYVKFIRFAQWRIERTGHGVLAFVTNHGYLDNPTFRGMRQSLMASFDEIYLLDLHGNSKKKEKAPDGGKDDNVFDIQQGVAIGLFVRKPGVKRWTGDRAKVFHADLYGLRKDKYRTLDSLDIQSTDWQALAPAAPQYYFVPQDTELLAEYERGWKVTEAMPVNVLGFQTHRDEFAIDTDRSRLLERIAEMRDRSVADEVLSAKYDLGDKHGWRLDHARRVLSDAPDWEDALVRVAYRPFDDRWGYFSETVMDRPRRELREHVAAKENTCLVVSRQALDGVFKHVLITKAPAEGNFLQSAKGGNSFPLWLYPSDQPADLLEAAQTERRPNLSDAFVAALKAAQGRAISPEDTLAYLYAVLHTPGYRQRYADFLRRDFPRVPLTSNKELFAALVKLGHELIGLHTLQAPPARISGFPVAGSGEVVKPRFAIAAGQSAGRVWINDAQYFDGVPQAVWDLHIGGYRVAEKWLKDRRGRLLTYDDITHYQNVVAALARTLAIQAELDAAVAGAGGWPLQ
ncbi:DNA methyltransferase [Burkholderiales bacterium]